MVGGFLGYIVEVTLKAVHEAPLGLSNILFFARFASDTVYQVGRLAGDVVPTYIRPACHTASNSTGGIEFRAVSTVLGSACVVKASGQGFARPRSCRECGSDKVVSKVFWPSVAMPYSALVVQFFGGFVTL